MFLRRLRYVKKIRFPLIKSNSKPVMKDDQILVDIVNLECKIFIWYIHLNRDVVYDVK